MFVLGILLFEQINEQVSKILPADSTQVKEKESASVEMIPKPPEMPPPPSLLKDVESERKEEVEKDKAKVSSPGLPVIPPLSFPKIGIPAVNVQQQTEPKVPMSSKVIPVDEKQKQSKEEEKKEKEEDDFVLNEVSLKKFVGQVVDKEKTQESPAVIEKEKDAELAAAVKKKKAAEARKQALEEAQQRKQALLQQAAEKKRLAEERRAEAKRIADEKKAEAERQRLLAVEKKSAEVRLQKAKPGATISLGFFSLGQSKSVGEVGKDVTLSMAPKGVATISKWTQNRDGSISGRISGSSAFTDGESITTSPITTKEPLEKSIVTSISGSRYVKYIIHFLCWTKFVYSRNDY